MANKHSNQPVDQVPEPKLSHVIKAGVPLPLWLADKATQVRDQYRLDLPHGVSYANEGDTLEMNGAGELTVTPKPEKK